MVESIRVSVIIPVYNTEKYLTQCLDSMISQTYDDMEIIIVDDGSKETLFEIYNRYQAMDKRIQVIKKNHEGVSKARNIGIDLSRGQYLLFVDADDYAEKTYIEKLVKSIENSDLAICAYIRQNENEKSVIYRDSGMLSKEELFIHTFCSNFIGGSCWNKIFKKTIIKQEKLRFEETISMGEDMLFLAEYYRLCKKINYIGEPLYYYRCNPLSVMQQSYQYKQFDIKQISCLQAVDKLGELYKNDTEIIKDCIAYRKVRTSLWVLYQMIFCNYYNKEIQQKIQALMKTNCLRYYKNTYATSLERFTVFGMCIFPWGVYHIAKFVMPKFNRKMKKYLV